MQKTTLNVIFHKTIHGLKMSLLRILPPKLRPSKSRNLHIINSQFVFNFRYSNSLLKNYKINKNSNTSVSICCQTINYKSKKNVSYFANERIASNFLYFIFCSLTFRNKIYLILKEERRTFQKLMSNFYQKSKCHFPPTTQFQRDIVQNFLTERD